MSKGWGGAARDAGRASAGNTSGGFFGPRHASGKTAKGKGGLGKPAKGNHVKKDWLTGKPIVEKDFWGNPKK